MTRIESEEIRVNKPIEEVYQFLSELKNYELFMPAEVRSFQLGDQSAQINIQGLGDISIAIGEQRKPEYLTIVPQGKIPVQFHMFWELKSIPEGTALIGGANAQLNMMMKMMVEPKLRSFVAGQAAQVKKVIEENA